MRDLYSVRLYVSICVAVLLLFGAFAFAQPLEIRSPDNNLVITLSCDAQAQGSVAPFWSVTWKGRAIILPSRLGLTLKDGTELGAGMRVSESSTQAHDTTWKPVYGEQSQIRDRYNALDVILKDEHAPGRRLEVIFRAYDEGAAVCYTMPKQEGLDTFTIGKELTQFRFSANHICYPTYMAQSMYETVRLSQVKHECERPLTVAIDDHTYAAVAEARLVDYARMRLQPAAGMQWTLEPDLGSDVQAKAPFATPWRVVMVGESPGGLLEHSYLFLNLNDPCAIDDTSWIKPGKIIREMTISTDGAKACVDFAVERGLQYIEFDTGWYGKEEDPKSDARKPWSSRLDMPEVVRYATEHNIGVWLYVNYAFLKPHFDELLPLYKQWGIRGIKFGFVGVGTQECTAWLHEAVRKAAEQHFMVDVHDEYRPTGYSRTYPNLLAQEGVRGNENMPTAEQNLMLPFTRYLCGAADYTICWYTDRIKTTHAHQLAASVVYYSPLQFLFWYDRPTDYRGELELAFFKAVPTVWDETRVLQGEIGRFIAVARRSGEDWYIGVMNAEKRRSISVPLKFLRPGQPYLADIYADGAPSGENPTAVACLTPRVVRAEGTLQADCAQNGGQAIRLVPVSG
jgi:alpha-glucosidase